MEDICLKESSVARGGSLGDHPSMRPSGPVEDAGSGVLERG